MIICSHNSFLAIFQDNFLASERALLGLCEDRQGSRLSAMCCDL